MKIDNFFAELKRRNVYRVAVAYAVVAWLTIQAASIFLPAFNAPQRVMQIVILILMVGFPIALAFSWAFEITPEGLQRTSWSRRKFASFVIIVALFAGALLAFKLFWTKRPAPQQTPGAIGIQAELSPSQVVSLYRLFKEDVSGIKSVDFAPVRIYVQHSDSVQSVEPRLHADFVGLSKFVSFYIPSSPVVRDVIRLIADNFIGLTGIDRIELVLTKPGEYPQSTDGMKFTGSIVIYHEDALSNADLANLEDYYRTRELTPIWRGTGYVQTQILLRNNRDALLKLSQVPSSMAAPANELSITGITAGVDGEQIRIKNKGRAKQ